MNEKTQFFHFAQNNSGGSFDFELNKYSHHVIIEARNAEHANALAEELGLYFDGCENGIDCDCCGDRWYQVHSDDGDDVPLVYGKPPEIHEDAWFGKDQPHTYVHFLDGTTKGYYNPTQVAEPGELR